MRILHLTIAATLLATAVLVPTAVAQDVPDAIDDPVGAVAPQEPAPTPDPAPRPDPGPQPDPAPAAGGAIDGIADATADEPQVAAQGAGPAVGAGPFVTAPAATGTGQLPFTGPDPRQLMLLLLVGSVITCGGIVATAWASAHARIR